MISIPTSKCVPPPVRPDYIPRERLLTCLDEALRHPLTLVIAPAGFGKTTLLASWVNILDCAAAWVTLTESDNQDHQLGVHLFAALEIVHPQMQFGTIRQRLQKASKPQEDVVLTLLNALESLPTDNVLVIDDFHILTNPTVLGAISYLIENLPPHIHLVIGSRTNPALPLARLRARAQLVELQAADLRFSVDEATAFLNGVMGLHLLPAAVAELDARTEGWIAGLQLAALSLQKRDDPAEAIEEIAGDNRYIRDFLLQEVFAQQSSDTQNFLLATALPERLTATLCDALTGHHDSQQRLECLESNNLFLTPLDMSRRWFRYHQLFQDFLRARLERTQSDCVPDLHRRASEWYAAHDQPRAAVEHALAAGDFERVADLIAVPANFEMLVEQENLFERLEWLNALPEDIKRAYPYLAMLQVAWWIHSGQLDLADEWLTLATTLAANRHDSTLHIMLGLLHAELLGRKQEFAAALEVNQALLQHPLPEQGWLRVWLYSELGFLYEINLDFAAARQILTDLTDQLIADGNLDLVQDPLCSRALLEMRMGDFPAAADSCRHAIRMGLEFAAENDQQPISGRPYVYLAHILYEWNQLDAALNMAQMAMECSERWEMYFYAEAYLRIASIEQTRGDHTAAMRAIQRAADQAERALNYVRSQGARSAEQSYEQLLYWIKQNRAHILLRANNLDQVDAMLAREDADFDTPPNSYLIRPRLGILRGHSEPAHTVLDEILALPENAAQHQQLASWFALKAAVYYIDDDLDNALGAIDRALHYGQNGRLVRTYLDLGDVVITVLRQAVQHGVNAVEAARVLAAVAVDAAQPQSTAPGSTLTERDLDILRLIAEGLTNREIAEELVLTVGTVKWYTNSIYSKLGVRNRVQAVERARTLGEL